MAEFQQLLLIVALQVQSVEKVRVALDVGRTDPSAAAHAAVAAAQLFGGHLQHYGIGTGLHTGNAGRDACGTETNYDNIVLLVPSLGQPELVWRRGRQRFRGASGNARHRHGASYERAGRFQEVAAIKGISLSCSHGSSSLQ